MSDARPGTRMQVVDWSGRRMLATRDRAGMGPESWGLLRRLALRGGFGGLAARWDGSRFLATKIEEALAGWFTDARARPWDFLGDAPEGEVLALWTLAEEDGVALPARGRRRPGLFPAGANPPGRALRSSRLRRIARVPLAGGMVGGTSPRLARGVPVTRGGDHGLSSETVADGGAGTPLVQAVLGPRIREFRTDLAADTLGFVRLRSTVPMGTAGTLGVARARDGLLRTVDLAHSQETRLEAGDGPEWPEVGMTARMHRLGRTGTGQPFVPVSARGVAARSSRSAAGADLRRDAGRPPRAPDRVPGDVAAGVFASAMPFSEAVEAGVPLDVVLERPEVAFLAFSRGRPGKPAGTSAVFPERVVTRTEASRRGRATARIGAGTRPVEATRSAVDIGKGRRGRAKPSAEVAHAEDARGTPGGFVARAFFTPRRAGVEAPWFAPVAQPAPVFGRSLWSASMGPVWPWEAMPSASRTYPGTPEASTTGAPVAGRPGAATSDRSRSLIASLGAATSGSRRLRDLQVAPVSGPVTFPTFATGTAGMGEVTALGLSGLSARFLSMRFPAAGFTPVGLGEVHSGRSVSNLASFVGAQLGAAISGPQWLGDLQVAPFLDLVAPGTPANRVAETEEGVPLGLSGLSARSLSVRSVGAGVTTAGLDRVYPERVVARARVPGGLEPDDGTAAGARARAGTPGTESSPAGGIRTATFAPRRAGVVGSPGALPDVRMADEVLVALGMKAPARGGVAGAGVPAVAPWAGRVFEGSGIAVSESVIARLEGGVFEPWGFTGDAERAWLAFAGGGRSGRAVAAEEGGRVRPRPREVGLLASLVIGTRRHEVVPASPRAEPGPFGTTPLASLMAPVVPPVWSGRGRTEAVGLLDASQAATWMLEGLLRVGLRDDGRRFEGSGRGLWPVARIVPRSGAGGRPMARPAETGWRSDPALGGSEVRVEARDRPLAVATDRYGETLLTRTLGFREVGGRGRDATAPVPAETGNVGRSPRTSSWEFPGDLEEVFLRVSWAERIEDLDGAVAPTASGIGRLGVRESAAERPGGRRAETGPTSLTRPSASQPGFAWPTGMTRAGGMASDLVRAVQAKGGAPRARRPARDAGFRPSLATLVQAGPGASSMGGARPEMEGRSRRWRGSEAADDATGILVNRLVAGAAASGVAGTPDRPGAWYGPAAVMGEEATLLLVARSPEREAGAREAAGEAGSRGGAGAIPAGTMWFIQRTLGRALRGLPPEAWGEPGAQGGASGLVPADLAGLLGIVPVSSRVAQAEATEAGRRPGRTDGAAGDLLFSPGTGATTAESRTIRPERVEVRAPGLPEEPVTLELSLGDAGPAGPVVGPGMAPSLGGLVRTGETPGPALRGLPLVAPLVSVVASQAMMSRRSEGPAARPARTPDAQASAGGGQGEGSQPIDLDVLAMEMAERILRRMKRDKERRGHHD